MLLRQVVRLDLATCEDRDPSEQKGVGDMKAAGSGAGGVWQRSHRCVIGATHENSPDANGTEIRGGCEADRAARPGEKVGQPAGLVSFGKQLPH